MSYDGKDRRNPMFDKDFYDKVSEMHGDVKQLVQGFKDHLKDDKDQFASVKKRIFYLTISMVIVYCSTGGIGILVNLFK